MLNRMGKLVSILILVFILNSCSEKTYPDFKNKDLKECSNFPEPLGYINDFESVFDTEQSIILFDLVYRHELKTTNQLAVVSISDLSPYSNINDYSLDLANCWGVGLEDKNNGIAIVFSKKLRKTRIQVGNGLLERLTNTETKKIIDNIIIPEFKKGNYFEGIRRGLKAIFKEVE